ncbi:MAG: DNA repair protein RecN [Clostridiales bacterium]|nr:DNA repair protein RecN [Clostridiales bacterium]
MLCEIYIENIAVIEKVSVSFTNGFNVFTGETGAGKSIIIDAINAVLGQRTSKELIRTGEERAIVSAVFGELNGENVKALENLGFYPDEDGAVILYREMLANGKNICRINGMPANVSMLREASKSLVTIHGQHESYELLTPELHMRYLDYYGKLNELVDKYELEYNKYRELKNKLDSQNDNESERLRKIDMLKYQIEEIEEACLEEGEDEQLAQRKKALLSSEKIRRCMANAENLLNGDEDTNGAVSIIKEACDELSDAAQYLDDLEELAQRLSEVYYELDDISNEIMRNDDLSDNVEQELEETEERLELIYRLERKYGSTIGEVLATLEDAKKELEYLESYEYNMEQLTLALEKQNALCIELADELSEKRKQFAEIFSQNVRQQLEFLNMPNVKLSFEFEKVPLYSGGRDKAEMLISANAGEEPRPISKIASGGELSRIMLAVKNVLADGDFTEALIFDEIDTGISGNAAYKVGLKLKEISKTKQVICITHQTQLACLADTHFLISKDVKNGRSYTSVEALDYDARVNELARIMSGDDVSELTLEHAREMLDKQNDSFA